MVGGTLSSIDSFSLSGTLNLHDSPGFSGTLSHNGSLVLDGTLPQGGLVHRPVGWRYVMGVLQVVYHVGLGWQRAVLYLVGYVVVVRQE